MRPAAGSMLPPIGGDNRNRGFNQMGVGLSGLSLSRSNQAMQGGDEFGSNRGFRSNIPSSPLVNQDSILLKDYHAKNRAELPDPPKVPQYSLFPVSSTLTSALPDDWDRPTQIPGESSVLDLGDIHYMSPKGVESIGGLHMSYYQLYFFSYKSQRGKCQPLIAPICIPAHSIDTCAVDSKNVRSSTTIGSVAAWVDIICKDNMHYRFGFENSNNAEKIVQNINAYSSPTSINNIFAYEYYKGVNKHITLTLLDNIKLAENNIAVPHDPMYADYTSYLRTLNPDSLCLNTISEISQNVKIPDAYNGWKLFDSVAEYNRMNISPNYRITTINMNYEMCDTYPSLLVVPATNIITDNEYFAISKFRSGKRNPALSWKNPNGDQTIWRCSQPGAGIMNSRCPEDERLFQYISDTNSVCKTVKIFDARPKANAMVNGIAGKGYESSSNYKSSSIVFMNIENIHKVRNSYVAFTNTLNKTENFSQYYIELANSQWFYNIFTILKAVHEMVMHIDYNGGSLVTHCSDGWDRTAQLCALTKLCVDPYYRTIRGFINLIEHDWLSFGHKFHERLSLPGIKFPSDQRSPVFIQFLDCVYQLLIQFPRHFEFTSTFLVQIATHIYTCRFGTFMFNNERERRQGGFSPDKSAFLKSNVYDSVSLNFGGNWPNGYSTTNNNSNVANNNSEDASGNESELNSLHSSPSSSTIPAPSTSAPIHVLANSTMSLWTYLLASPAAVAGLFTNGAYSDKGCGDPVDVDPIWPYISNTVNYPFPPSSMKDFNNTSSVANTCVFSNVDAPLVRGSTLYPSYDVRKIQLWSDYYMRNIPDKTPLNFPSIMDNCGNVFPGGATTPGLSMHYTINQSQHLLYAKHIANEATKAFVIENHTRTKLEAEYHKVNQLLALYKEKFGEITNAEVSGQLPSLVDHATDDGVLVSSEDLVSESEQSEKCDSHNGEDDVDGSVDGDGCVDGDEVKANEDL